MIGPERARVFPLGVGDLVPFPDRDPAVFAGGNARTLIGLVEPRNYSRRFGPVAVARFVVVRQRALKRVLARGELRRNKIVPMRFLRIVEPAVVLRPVCIPRAGAIWDWIVRGWFFADPENRSDYLFSPREFFTGLVQRRIVARHRRVSNGIDLQEPFLLRRIRFLAQLYFRRRHRGRSGVREKRRNGRKQDGDGVGKFSWFHRMPDRSRIETCLN